MVLKGGALLLSTILGAQLLVSIETPAQIQQGWWDMGYTGRILGYATWGESDGQPVGCEIHVPPLTLETMGIWKHEIRHCTEGRWHDD